MLYDSREMGQEESVLDFPLFWVYTNKGIVSKYGFSIIESSHKLWEKIPLGGQLRRVGKAYGKNRCISYSARVQLRTVYCTGT